MISFRTKEESNQIQKESFLRLSKEERIYHFLRLMEQVSMFPTNTRKEKKHHFIIKIEL